MNKLEPLVLEIKLSTKDNNVRVLGSKFEIHDSAEQPFEVGVDNSLNEFKEYFTKTIEKGQICFEAQLPPESYNEEENGYKFKDYYIEYPTVRFITTLGDFRNTEYSEHDTKFNLGVIWKYNGDNEKPSAFTNIVTN